MIDSTRLAMPWSRPGSLYSAPGRLVLKLAMGEAPETIPAVQDVRAGASPASHRVDGGRIDRLLARFMDRVRVSRVHGAAASVARPGARHVGFDDIERAIGLDRLFCIEADRPCCVVDVVDALRQLHKVEYATHHYLCTLPFEEEAPKPLTFDFDQAWSSRHVVRAVEAMAYEPGSPSVLIAVIDTGVVADHPELSAQLAAGFDTVDLGAHDISAGLELLGDRHGVDNEPLDEVGHGTACAGIITATGEKIPPGLSSGCNVIPIRVLGSARVPGKKEPFGLGAVLDIDRGLKRAIDLGASVLNLSFGTPEGGLDPNDPTPHAEMIRYGLARGCVMVAASGNAGTAEKMMPAALDGVIAVGSVGPDGKPSSFSSRGDHVAIAAPGERIISAGVGGYQMVTGTSFAAPFVTATAALLVSRARRRSVPLTAQDVRRILMASARPWRQPGHGAGVLDAVAALRLLDREIDRADDDHDAPEARSLSP